MTDLVTARTAGPTDLAPEQIATLLAPINPNRVQHLRGQSHVEAWDVRRWLTRIFGFGGWSDETLELVCVSEREINPGRWTVVYRAQTRLTIKTVDGRSLSFWDDAAMGDSRNQPSLGDAHDMAMKTALSQALKRCAVNLGDAFGLSLYNDGSPNAVVMWSAAHPTPKSTPQQQVVEDEPVKPEQPPTQLRSVPEGEPDPWATPAVKGRSQPAQDIADVATRTSNQGAVKDLYRQAHNKGLLAETVKVDRELLELGAYLIARGKELAAPAPEPKVVKGVVVEDVELPADEHAAAVAALRTWATEQGITDIDADAYTALGAPLADVSAAAIWGLLSALTDGTRADALAS
ncbi:Rad52/Rad22 family DNA repair protein [Streptomyces sp. SID5770]|uniref:Rad52/Rad22 family DNA repair protein n=1 Tax=Streptomyces sp. SID5770 TaxID=2690308 RepID=UPI0023515798|nr:Rad52/Rad22 family DNA repair protein [Streptomyces sp. SID5770]